MSSDAFLRPGLAPPTDVELYASEAAGGTTYAVDVAVTATATATVARTVSAALPFGVTATGAASVIATFIPAEVEPPPSPAPDFGHLLTWTRTPRKHRISVSVSTRGTVSMSVRTDRAGRRAAEDELVLVGAF